MGVSTSPPVPGHGGALRRCRVPQVAAHRGATVKWVGRLLLACLLVTLFLFYLLYILLVGECE